MLTPKQYKLFTYIYISIKNDGFTPSYDEMMNFLGLHSKSAVFSLISSLEKKEYIKKIPNKARAIEIIKLPRNFNDGEDSDIINAINIDPDILDKLKKNKAKIKNFNQNKNNVKNHNSFEKANFTPSGNTEKYNSANTGTYTASGYGTYNSKTHNYSSDAFKNGANDSPHLNQDQIEINILGHIAAGTPIEAISQPLEQIFLPSNFVNFNKEYFALIVTGDSMINAGIFDGDVVVIEQTNNANNGDIVVALINNEEATLKKFRKTGDQVSLIAENPQYKNQIYKSNQVKIQGKLAFLFRNY